MRDEYQARIEILEQIHQEEEEEKEKRKHNAFPF
jgi:hypothetical protein